MYINSDYMEKLATVLAAYGEAMYIHAKEASDADSAVEAVKYLEDLGVLV